MIVLTSITDPDGNPITDASHIAIINPYRYRGYSYDTEIELYCLRSRYYDAQVGRFLNGDGAGILTVLLLAEHITVSNLFAYCKNNPVMNCELLGCA